MKHNLKISVSKEPQTGGVVRCRNVSLREKLLTLLLGRKERMMILIPGNSIAELHFDRNSPRAASRSMRRWKPLLVRMTAPAD
jgi:hypothetical protein